MNEKQAYEAGWRVTDDGCLLKPDGTEKKPYIITDGYPQFSFKGSNIRVHRLAAYCFYGEELYKHQCVRHLNGIKEDFSRKNIALGTQKDNMADIPKEQWEEINKKRSATAKSKGIKPPRVNKITDDQAKKIRDMYSQGVSLRKLANMYGVHHSTIWNITTNRTFKGV